MNDTELKLAILEIVGASELSQRDFLKLAEERGLGPRTVAFRQALSDLVGRGDLTVTEELGYVRLTATGEFPRAQSL